LQTVECPLKIQLGKNDRDWRFTGKSYDEALDEAFNMSRTAGDKFKMTIWCKDKYGKSVPV
jgi:hypothetical protein